MRIVPLLALLPSLGLAAPGTYVNGKVRVEILSPNLVRLEQRGPRGFEDRPTFTVVNRDFGKVPVNVLNLPDRIAIRTPFFTVVVLNGALSLADASVLDADSKVIFTYEGKLPKNTELPAPGKVPSVWTMSDTPRLIPPAWGATPAPKSVDSDLESKSGWDDRNDSPDVYVFVPGAGGYKQLRQDFLRLTGPVPKPPLYVLGFIDSRYHPYTEKEALDSIDTYRKKGIPLDTFVVDTDWRVNGSDGYEVEKRDFPDMPKFIQEAHDRHVHLMFNDHPNPKATGATDPAELAFRWEGLSKLMDWGMDIWWYDRNWSTSLPEPMKGIHKEIWGQRLYHDMTEKAKPSIRPWIMTNAQGIDNGIAHYSADPAGHRYPMWWTGDTGSQFEYLRSGVENGVDRGILDLQPYTHEDLGGHTGPTPSPELYIRYLEYGCLSPITRVHCTRGQDRHPWAFGEEAERIVTNYIKLRYRLLPMLYSAAQRATDDGTPIIRRCDYYWPTYPQAAGNHEYLLGDDTLVAPIMTSAAGDLKPISADMLRTADGQPGLQGEYFDNANLSGIAKKLRTDSQIGFDWSGSSPMEGIPQENFSVRWTGNLGPVPETGRYRILTKNDDGVRVFIDGKLLIDDWKAEDSATQAAEINLTAGSTHTLRIEYMQLTGNALCTVGWTLPSQSKATQSVRDVWIPPGRWHDVWSGKMYEGPATISVTANLDQIPMFVGHGGIVLTGPELQYAGEKPLDPITADVYVGNSFATTRELIEDDGISTRYLKGELARTAVSAYENEPNMADVVLGATKGRYKGMPETRNWVVRLHLPVGKSAEHVMVDGLVAEFKVEPAGPVVMPFQGGSAPEEGEVVSVRLPTSSIKTQRAVKLFMKDIKPPART